MILDNSENSHEQEVPLEDDYDDHNIPEIDLPQHPSSTDIETLTE